MKHDQLFKELSDNFFPEFHALIDFKTIKPLSEELFTDLIDGENRRVDLIIEAKLKDKDTLIVFRKGKLECLCSIPS